MFWRVIDILTFLLSFVLSLWNYIDSHILSAIFWIVFGFCFATIAMLGEIRDAIEEKK